MLPHTYSATLGCCSRSCFLLGARALRAVAAITRWLVAAGAAPALALLTRPEFAPPLPSAGCVWLVCACGARPRRSPRGALVRGAGAGDPGRGLRRLPPAVSPHTLLSSRTSTRATSSRRRATRSCELRAPLTLASFAELGGARALRASASRSLVLVARLLERARACARALPVALSPSARSCSRRSRCATRRRSATASSSRTAGSRPARLAAAVVLVVRAAARRQEWSPLAQIALALTVALAVLAATRYAAFFIARLRARRWPSTRSRSRRLPRTAAPGRAGTRTSRRSLSARPGSPSSPPPAGADAQGRAARVARRSAAPAARSRRRPAEAARLPARARARSSAQRPGEPILLAPQLTWLYTCPSGSDPLPELSLLPGALPTPPTSSAAIAELERGAGSPRRHRHRIRSPSTATRRSARRSTAGSPAGSAATSHAYGASSGGTADSPQTRHLVEEGS